MSHGDLLPAPAAPAEVEIMAVWQSPFLSVGGSVRFHGQGATIAEIVAAFGGDLPSRFGAAGIVSIDGHVIERRYWRRVRPAATARLSGRPVTIALSMRLEGGGGRGAQTGRKIAGTVAMLALAVLTFGISNTAWGAALASALTISQAALASTVAVVGSLAIQAVMALTAAPVRSLATPSAKERVEKGAASAQGNVLRAGAPIPAVIGTRRVFPVQAAQPLITIDDADNEIVEAVYVLAGPHRLDAIRIGEADIADARDVTVQTREGWPDDRPIDLFQRHGATDQPQIELSAHQVTSDNQRALEAAPQMADKLPRWHRVASRRGADEVHVQLVLPEGLIWRDSPTTLMRLPLRLRIRPRGTTSWINLPELHYSEAEQSQMRLSVELRYDEPETIPAPPARGFLAAYKAVPAQAAQPVGGDWTADAYFSGGAGGDVLAQGAGASNVRHVHLTERRARIYLDPVAHPKTSFWEVEVMRGAVIRGDQWTTAAYSLAGTVWSLFGYQAGSPALIAASRSQLGERCYLIRIASIVNRPPIARAASSPASSSTTRRPPAMCATGTARAGASG